VIPRQVDEPLDAAVLAVNLEAFLEVAAHGDCQVEVPEAAVGEIDGDKPAVRAEALEETGANGLDLAAEEAGRIDEMAAVRQHEVTPLVRLRIALGLARVLTADGNRLQVV